MQHDILTRKSFLNSVKDCYKHEGYTGFYKGMSFPLYSVPLVNAVVFSIHELSKRMLGFHEETEMNIYEGLLCGSIAGFVNCLVVTPIELVKCRLQIQSENKNSAYYKGVLDCIRKTYAEGAVRALYKGNSATVLREIPAYAAQFGGYYYSRRILSEHRHKSVDTLNNLELMLCGSIGGYLCWQFSYPQDVIKTLIQTQSQNNHENTAVTSSNHSIIKFKAKFYDGGFYECGKYIYQTEGVKGFWRGYLPFTLRAMIGNAILFLTYENSKAFLTNLNKNE